MSAAPSKLTDMSKVDAQRAMREAKFARLNAAGSSRRVAPAAEKTTENATEKATDKATAAEKAPAVEKKAPAARKTSSTTARVADAGSAVSAGAVEGERCGHKSINGRACTRPAGHAEKSHRYG